MAGILHGVRQAVEAIAKDPLPTLVGIGLMSFGVPPVIAGGVSGAVGAAEHGGNIFKGALTGGFQAYVGQMTSTYLGGQGYSPVMVGAGTGAVLGATGSLLNGGKSMGLNALTGGIIGAATGYYVSKSGSQTVSYEDGSTVTKYPDGTTTATPANTVDAPVSDLNPPPVGITDAGTATQAVIADTSPAAIANTGMVNIDSANILADNGYTPSQVQDLIHSGYNVDQLVDLASTGVPADTLQTLSKSQFSESTITHLLDNNVSANDIASASKLVSNGQLDIHTANTLLNSGVDSEMLTDIVNSGQANQASYLLAKGVSADSVKYMIDNNVNLNDANWKLDTGRLSSNQINSNVENVFPAPKPIEPAPVQTQVTQPAPVQPVEPTVASNVPDYAIKAHWGDSSVYYDPLTQKVYNPDGSINEWAERAVYNGPEGLGIKTADATKVINDVTHTGTVSDTGNQPFKVDVSGAAGFKDNPNAVIQEYRTPGTNLATQEQIDNGTAQWNATANAWEVPNVTVTPPNINQPSNLQVAHVTVNPSDLITPGQPTVTTPTVNVPNVPVITTPTVTGPVTPTTTTTPETKQEEPLVPLKPLTPVEINPDDRKVTNVVVPEPVVTTPVVTTPEVIPYNPPPPPTTPPTVNVANPPLVDDTATTKKPTTYGHYTWGTAPQVEIPTGLNPGYIEPTPYYQTTNPAQSQYYWGSHPYQEGPTFNSQLYNTSPGAPAIPWGAGHIQTQATPAQILAAMQGLYPNLGTQTVTGPAVPIQ